MTNFDYIRRRLLRKAELWDFNKDYDAISNKVITKDTLHFWELQHNRLCMGLMRYGRPDRFNLDVQRKYIDDAYRRCNSYILSGNVEYLVDACNLIMLCYTEGTHPEKHFKAIDDGVHVETKDEIGERKIHKI